MEGRKLIQDYNFAMYTMENTNNTSYFAKLCENYGMHFNPQVVGKKDPLLSQVWLEVRNAAKEKGEAITPDDINNAFIKAKEGYDIEVNRHAEEILKKIHEPQKPLILIQEMNSKDIEMFMDLTRYTYDGPAEMQHIMNLPVTPLAAPAVDEKTRLNFAYRMIDNIRKFDEAAIMFTTEDATFVHCGNKAVAERLTELEKEHLREINKPEPTIGGRAGVLKEMAEFKGIYQPEVLQSFIETNGKFRETAIDATAKIFDEYNKQGLPIYASSKETCFISLDGGFHNYPLLMMPGDEITVMGAKDYDTFASIGDNQAELPESMTVVGVHTNEHGSIVITDAGVFAVGGVGKNIMDQIQHNREQALENIIHTHSETEIEKPDYDNIEIGNR